MQLPQSTRREVPWRRPVVDGREAFPSLSLDSIEDVHTMPRAAGAQFDHPISAASLLSSPGFLPSFLCQCTTAVAVAAVVLFSFLYQFWLDGTRDAR